MANHTFIGFSTASMRNGKRSWELYDIELIKQDLFNHFHTRFGERVGRPEYGCRLWEYIMEPNVSTMVGLIRAEVERIVRLDTRLDVRNVKVIDEGNHITVAMELLYLPFKSVESFMLQFDKNQGVV